MDALPTTPRSGQELSGSALDEHAPVEVINPPSHGAPVNAQGWRFRCPVRPRLPDLEQRDVRALSELCGIRGGTHGTRVVADARTGERLAEAVDRVVG